MLLASLEADSTKTAEIGAGKHVWFADSRQAELSQGWCTLALAVPATIQPHGLEQLSSCPAAACSAKGDRSSKMPLAASLPELTQHSSDAYTDKVPHLDAR